MNLGAIHIRAKEAQLDDAQYRQLLMQVAGVNSAKLLTEEQYHAVMAAMWERIHSLRQARRNAPRTPLEKKIWALWYDLSYYLPSPERNVRYLVGLCRRAADCPNFTTEQFGELPPKSMHKIIEALKLKIIQEQAAHEARTGVPF